MLTYAHAKYWIHPITSYYIIHKIMSTQELLWPGLYKLLILEISFEQGSVAITAVGEHHCLEQLSGIDLLLYYMFYQLYNRFYCVYYIFVN